MGETNTWPGLAGYREEVTELMEAGEPFAAVEEAIDTNPRLPEDAKAALWLLAFSMREQDGKERDAARAHLASVG